MIEYRLDFNKYYQHFVCVQLSFVAANDDPVLRLPTWIAGSYLIREFAKHITFVSYSVGQFDHLTPAQHSHRANKINKNHWQLHAKRGERLTLSYEVYCFDPSVRAAFVDSERIFANFSSLLLLIEQQEHAPCSIDLLVPNVFFKQTTAIATALPVQKTVAENNCTLYRFTQLPDGRHLTAFASFDHPFAIGEQDHATFDVMLDNTTILHRFFVFGKHSGCLRRLANDVQKICQGYVDWLGWAPFNHYIFITYASKSDYGGLEHLYSTALVTPRGDLPAYDEAHLPSTGYQRFLGLCSHEYFHAWWVKSVAPESLLHSSLNDEAYTPLLWIFEGFTSYIDDLMLYKTGVIDQDSYLALLADQITRYFNGAGRHQQTLAESSFDAWIKLYRPDENSPNSTISYYNKGALVAWGLDLLLRNYGHSLFELIKYFTDLAKPNHLAISPEIFDESMSNFLPKNAWESFKAYIYDTKELPIAQWLKANGIDIKMQQRSEPFGINTTETPAGLLITRVNNQASGALSGLSVHDVIVAINDLKADKKLLEQAAKQEQVKMHIFRQDVLAVITLTRQTPCPEKIISTKLTAISHQNSWLN